MSLAGLDLRLNPNTRRILTALRAEGPLARADLARLLAIEPSTITRLAAPLVAEGLLSEEPDPGREGRKGYPAKLLAIRPEGLFTAGVYIDPDRILTSLCDLTGQPLATEEVPVDNRAFDTLMTAAGASVRRLLAATGVDPARVAGCGVSYPGHYSATPRQVLRIRQFQGWPEVNVERDLSPYFGMPVHHMNDAKAACLAEMHYGSARHFGSFCHIWLSYGIGGAAVVDRRLHLGQGGVAAEWGGLFPKSLPRPSGQDLLGVLAEDGIHLAHLGDLDAGHLARPSVVDWAQRAAQQLRWLCLVIARTFAPEAIVIGGSMPPALIAGFIDRINSADMLGEDFFVQPPRILRAEQDRHPELGAAVLPVHDLFTPPNPA